LLPCGKTEEENEKREKMFKRIDQNGNGFLSLAEIDGGFNAMGEQFKIIFQAKKAMIRAFQAAKDFSPSKNKESDDYIERSEFRIFLLYLRQYFKYYLMFQSLDSSQD
jgi:hypothetical protein